MNLHSYTFGHPEQPPVVILHGLFGSGENWRAICRKLEDRYFVVAFDLRNHGKSGHAPVMQYEHLAGDVAQSMDALELSSANIIGHSMGGKTAMHLALLRPDLVDRLVVVDIAPRAYPPGHLKIFEALSSVDLDTLTSRADALQQLESGIPDKRVRQFLVKNLVGRHGAYRWRINLDAIRANYPFVIGGIDSFDLFENPTLFIRGNASDYVTDNDLETARAYFMDAEFVTLDGGHWIHADDQERFISAVREFLEIK